MQPRKRKESNTKMADASFKKHVYGREHKRAMQPIEDFDPRPPESRGTEKERLAQFLVTMQGQGLGISSLLDPKLHVWKEGCSSSAALDGPPCLPSKKQLVFRVQALKESLKLSPKEIRTIEMNTKAQHQSPLRHSERRFRITSSHFGDIKRRLASTPPDSLVLRILGVKRFSTAATQWGKDHEEAALDAYVMHQNDCGHSGLYACKSGFVVPETHPFLGTSPDGCVHDPSCCDPFGLVEIKCPYSHQHNTPEMACSSQAFCSSLETTTDGAVVNILVP